MKPILPLLICLAWVASACNMPALGAPATATASPSASPTATLPPTETPLPEPTQTPTLEPSATALVVTQPPPPTAAPPTATQPPPTASLPTPIPRALFQGTFLGGTFTFRIGEPANRVIPKTVVVKGGDCKEGGTINDSITFEPPPSFPIENARFTISQGNAVTISGQFLSPTRAGGTIILRLRSKGQTCTIGPIPWIANAGT